MYSTSERFLHYRVCHCILPFNPFTILPLRVDVYSMNPLMNPLQCLFSILAPTTKHHSATIMHDMHTRSRLTTLLVVCIIVPPPGRFSASPRPPRNRCLTRPQLPQTTPPDQLGGPWGHISNCLLKSTHYLHLPSSVPSYHYHSTCAPPPGRFSASPRPPRNRCPTRPQLPQTTRPARVGHPVSAACAQPPPILARSRSASRSRDASAPPWVYLPPTTHLNTANATSSQRDPCSPI